MAKIAKGSFRYQLLLTIGLLLIGVLAGSTSIALFVTRKSAYEEARVSAGDRILQFSQRAVFPALVGQVDSQVVNEFLGEVAQSKEVLAVELLNADGERLGLAGSDPEALQLCSFSESPPSGIQASVRRVTDIWCASGPVRESASTDLSESAGMGAKSGELRIASSTVALRRMMRGIILWNLLAGAVLFGLGSSLAWREIRRLTDPLKRLMGIMQELTTERTQVRAELKGPREVVKISEAFNALLTRLEEEGTIRESKLRAELELRSTEARLETAVWGAGIGLWELDFRTQLTRWFGEWCERLNLDPCEGKDHMQRWDENIHPDDAGEAIGRFRDHMAGKEDYYDAEYRIRDRTGKWRWLFERGRTVERAPDGSALRMVGVCMDIDARKEAELALIRTQHRLEEEASTLESKVRERTQELNTAIDAARSAERYKSVFMATVSHEMKTPLHVIQAYAIDIGNELEFAESAETARGHVGVIIKEVKELLRRLHQILDLARAEAGRHEIEPEEFGLREFCDDIYERTVPLARQNSDELVVRSDAVRIIADRDKLLQIVSNLLTNACKFTQAGLIEASLYVKETTLEIIVRDTGCGIPDDAKERVWQEFRQVEMDERRHVGGFGLGLAIVKRFTDILGGRVELTSEPSQGTTVSVWIPVQLV